MTKSESFLTTKLGHSLKRGFIFRRRAVHFGRKKETQLKNLIFPVCYDIIKLNGYNTAAYGKKKYEH